MTDRAGHADTPGNRPLVVCGLEAERRSLSHHARLSEKAEIVCTGPGVEAVIDYLVEDPPSPGRVVIMAGLAGALNPRLGRGEAFVAQRIITDDGESWTATWPEMSEKVRGLKSVKILTSREVLPSPRAKLAAREVSGADLVDTESSALAAWATEHENRFGVVRGVFDTFEDELPASIGEWVGTGGRVRYKNLILGLLQQPSSVRRLGEFARHANEAMDAVARLLEELL